jgi:putative pyruvate formate lyase activating enzyme
VGEPQHIRMRVLPDGVVVFTDPRPATLPVIRMFDPGFTVRTAPLPQFTRPRVIGTRTAAGGVPADALSEISTGQLWATHDNGLNHANVANPGEASLLDVKIELARRMLQSCELCALRCRVNRLNGERGRCGLGADAFVYEAYIHIAEEPPINPTLNVSLRGCGMRCLFCQQAAALNPRGRAAERLLPGFWNKLELGEARSLVFVGGNPTESLPAVLSFLRAAPANFALPIGWNCSGYDAVDAIRLLDGVADVYVPDFKYGNDRCATRWSEAPGYVDNAASVIAEMLRQRVPVLVRVLVLPGHEECCHGPALTMLAGLAQSGDLFVSIQGTYLPEWKALSPGGPLSQRPTADEVHAVYRRAQDLGLSIIG